MPLLNGCATEPRRDIVTLPPVVYLQQTPTPQFSGRTNADLLAWAQELKTALAAANGDKEAIRQWFDRRNHVE